MYLKTTIIFLTLVAFRAQAVGNSDAILESNFKNSKSQFESNLDPDFLSEPGITYLTKSVGLTAGYVSGKYHSDETTPVGLFGISAAQHTPIYTHEIGLHSLGSKVVSLSYNYSVNLFEGVRFKPAAILGLTENILASDGLAAFFNFNELQLNAGLGAEWQIKKIFNVSSAESFKISTLMSAGLKYTNVKLNLSYLFYWK